MHDQIPSSCGIKFIFYQLLKTKEMLKKETDYLAELYDQIDKIRVKIFYDTEISGDIYEFIKATQSQINLYRSALIK